MERSHCGIIAKFRGDVWCLIVSIPDICPLSNLGVGVCPDKLKRIDIKKTKVPLNDRICNLCNDNVIQDEIHFLYAVIFTLISDDLYKLKLSYAIGTFTICL